MQYAWSGLQMVGETSDSHPDAAVQYIYTENSYEPLARVDSYGEHADIFWYHTELNGLPDSVTDSNGETVWRGASTAWGHSLRESTPVLWDTPQNLRFQGQYLDRDTGLHYNTFRYYDPAGGCYTQMDPIGLRGGLNLYQYGPNPLSYIDPLGLITEDIKLNPGEILVNPKDINFSQTTINGAFDTPEGKRSVQSVINDVRRGDVKVTDFPAIKVVNVKGQLVARDGNSRLAIAIKAKAKQIKVIIENNVDQLRDFTSRSRKNGLPNTGTSETPKCK